jgi:hypothetical protein
MGNCRLVLPVAGCLALLVTAAPPLCAQDAAVAGRVRTVAGSVSIVRGGAVVPAASGALVMESDVVRTGPDGRIGIVLKDDTRVALGPTSEVRLDRFAFAPAEGRLGFVLRVLKGVATYVSGRIAKLAPDAVRLETPTAIVGVRGTTVAIRVEE